MRDRLRFAYFHQNWTIEQWKNVLWTDESKFQLFNTNRRVFVRRFAGERFSKPCLVPTVKHGGGSVMVWGAISGKGVGPLVKEEGIVRKEDYKKILVKYAVPTGKNLLGKNFVFQQDNDPKHTSILCKTYLATQEKKGWFKSYCSASRFTIIAIQFVIQEFYPS